LNAPNNREIRQSRLAASGHGFEPWNSRIPSRVYTVILVPITKNTTTVGKEERLFIYGAKHLVSFILWGNKRMWCRFSSVFRGLVASVPPQTS